MFYYVLCLMFYYVLLCFMFLCFMRYIFLFIYLFLYLFIYFYIYLFIYYNLFIRIFIHLFIYIYTNILINHYNHYYNYYYIVILMTIHLLFFFNFWFSLLLDIPFKINIEVFAIVFLNRIQSTNLTSKNQVSKFFPYCTLVYRLSTFFCKHFIESIATVITGEKNISRALDNSSPKEIKEIDWTSSNLVTVRTFTTQDIIY